MHTENVTKLAEYLRSQGLQAALLANPFNLTWLTGYAPPIQTGPSPFEGGPALGWFQNGELTLLVSDGEAGPAGAAGASLLSYAGYTVDEPLACPHRMADAFNEMLKRFAGLKGKVGVETGAIAGSIIRKTPGSPPSGDVRRPGPVA